MHITITGKLGSGKSTICLLLAERFKFQIFSTGDLHRRLAVKMGLDTISLNRLMSSDQKYDKMIDDEVVKLAKENVNEGIIFDSRLAWHFVENSFKLFTTVDPAVAARRVFSSDRGKEERYMTEKDALAKLKIRSELEKTRFKNIYGINYYDYNNYNLIIDTTWLTPSELASIIICHYTNYIDFSSKPPCRILISPKSLYPTAPFAELKQVEVPNDFFASQPLQVVCREGYHYVLDKNNSLAAALSAGLPYVYAESAETSGAQVPLTNLDKKLIFELEDIGGFTYASVPELYLTDGR
jgi:cytidylate kinase